MLKNERFLYKKNWTSSATLLDLQTLICALTAHGAVELVKKHQSDLAIDHSNTSCSPMVKR